MSQPSPTMPTAQSRDLKDLTRLIQRAPGFAEVIAALKNGRSATIDGAWGSAGPLTVAGLGLHAPKTLVIVMAHVGDVDDFRDDVATFAGIMPEVFPAWERLPKEAGPGDEVFGRRLRVVKALRSSTPPRFVVAPMQAFLQPVPTAEVLARSSKKLGVGDVVPIEGLSAWLIEKGMSRVEVVEVAGEFSIRGGILDVFPPDASDPVRVEFFGDEVESIRPFDPETQRSLDRLGLGRPSPSLPGSTADDLSALGHVTGCVSLEDAWVVAGRAQRPPRRGPAVPLPASPTRPRTLYRRERPSPGSSSSLRSPSQRSRPQARWRRPAICGSRAIERFSGELTKVKAGVG